MNFAICILLLYSTCLCAIKCSYNVFSSMYIFPYQVCVYASFLWVSFLIFTYTHISSIIIPHTHLSHTYMYLPYYTHIPLYIPPLCRSTISAPRSRSMLWSWTCWDRHWRTCLHSVIGYCRLKQVCI